jgi:prepilin-type N-terminal cleavage/methylation domain-containing protein
MEPEFRTRVRIHRTWCEEHVMIERQSPAVNRRAFSLIELLVVILIIALVIAIAIPSLAGARNSARAAGSRALLTQITQASSQFERDERRMPGFFDAREMGHAENADRGFTAMHNLMLDLAGGIVTGNDGVEVGPMAQRTVRVDPKLIGTAAGNNKGYFVPDRKNFIDQTEQGQIQTSVQGHRSLPTVVDTFGNPVLAWVQNEAANGPISQTEHFALVATPTGTGAQQAKFYWNSNAGFLRATGTGRRFINQTDAARGSLLGGQLDAQSRQRSLAGLLGHPSYPSKLAGVGDPPVVASAARGMLVVHSAGTDGVFFGRSDRGARQFNLDQRAYLDYRVNFAPDPTQPVGNGNDYTDREGRRINNDITLKFDDILAVGGN